MWFRLLASSVLMNRKIPSHAQNPKSTSTNDTYSHEHQTASVCCFQSQRQPSVFVGARTNASAPQPSSLWIPPLVSEGAVHCAGCHGARHHKGGGCAGVQGVV